jgi:lysophospholipase L1-like esterase
MNRPFSIRRGLCLLGLCALSAGAARAQITILPLGDSITWGYNIDSTATAKGSAGYRYQLFEDLGASTSDVTFLGSQSDNGSVSTGLPLLPSSETHNEGHNGYTIEGVDAELEGNGNTQSGRSDSNNGGFWLTSGSATGTPLNPDVVLLDIGTNDATDGESATTMEAQLTTLLDHLKLDLPSTTQIFVGNLTPRTDNSGMEAVEETYNADVSTIVANEDSTNDITNFHFVDIHDAVPASDINTTDGQHPTAAGYALIGNAWYGAMVDADVIPEPSTYALMGAGALVLVVIARRRLVRA